MRTPTSSAPGATSAPLSTPTARSATSSDVRHVTYIFTGKSTKKGESGRAIPRDSLPTQVKRLGDLNVYTVEVCPDCHWHHLIESFWIGPKGQAVG